MRQLLPRQKARSCNETVLKGPPRKPIMDQPAASHQSSALSRLAVVFSLASLVAIGIGIVVMALGGDSSYRVALGLSGLGAGLGLAYLIVSLVRRRARPVGRTVLSIFVAIALMGLAGVIGVFEDISGTFWEPTPVSLGSAMETGVMRSSGPAAGFLTTGKSGSLDSLKWKNPDGGDVVIDISWQRNELGILVTATPTGSIPKGQDGTPITQQILKNGDLGFPLPFFKTAGAEFQKGWLSDLSPWLLMFDEVFEGSARPIIEYASKHDGDLPDVEEAASRLSKVKKVFRFDCSADPDAVGKTDKTVKVPMAELVIERYTYRPGTDGMFSIEYAWSTSSKLDGGDLKPDDSGIREPMTGVFTIDFTTSGLIGLPMKKGNPVLAMLDDLQTADRPNASASKPKTAEEKGSSD